MEFFDHDPLTGLVEYYEEVDGKIHIHTYQDVEPVLEWCKKLRNEGLPDEGWNKNEVSVYAVLPAVALAHMAKKGIRFLDQNDIKKVVQTVNSEFPYCKTTYKHHAL